MIKVSPMYLETLQGDVLAMKVRVYNLPDISSIDINLVDYRLVGNSYIGPTSVVIDPQIAKVAGYGITTEADYSTTVRFTLRNMSDRPRRRERLRGARDLLLPDHMYEVSPFETATFTPAVLLDDRQARQRAADSSRSRPRAPSSCSTSYNARHIAYWDMGYGDISSVIYDQSANGLDGTATGTAVVYGATRDRMMRVPSTGAATSSRFPTTPCSICRMRSRYRCGSTSRATASTPFRR